MKKPSPENWKPETTKPKKIAIKPILRTGIHEKKTTNDSGNGPFFEWNEWTKWMHKNGKNEKGKKYKNE